MTLSVQVTSNYLKRKSALRPADCLIRRNSGRFQSPFGSGLVIIATLLETAVGKKQQCLPLTNPARAGIVCLRQGFLYCRLWACQGPLRWTGRSCCHEDCVLERQRPCGLQAQRLFACPCQLQSGLFLLSGNQDPLPTFYSRISPVLEPRQTPGIERFLFLGLTDVFCAWYPQADRPYIWWSMRLNKRLENRGQLGYFLVSDALLPAVRRITHHMDILASDHRPISPTRCLATFRKELPDKE